MLENSRIRFYQAAVYMSGCALALWASSCRPKNLVLALTHVILGANNTWDLADRNQQQAVNTRASDEKTRTPNANC